MAWCLVLNSLKGDSEEEEEGGVVRGMAFKNGGKKEQI